MKTNFSALLLTVLALAGASLCPAATVAQPIAWTPNTTKAAATGYRIYLVTQQPTDTNADGFADPASVVAPVKLGADIVAPATTATVSFVYDATKRYWVVVTAYNAAGESRALGLADSYSNALEVAPALQFPGAPSGVKVSGPLLVTLTVNLEGTATVASTAP